MRAGDLLLFTDWRGDPDERLTGDRGSEVASALRRRRPAEASTSAAWSGARTGTGSRSRAEREPPPGRGDQRGRRRVPARHAGAARRLAPPEVRRPAPPAAGPSSTSRSSAGSTCATAAATTSSHAGDPQRQTDGRGLRRHRPPWHDVQLAIRGPAVGDVETVFRERWEDPQPLSRNPIRRVGDAMRRDDSAPRARCRRSCPIRRADGTARRSSCCAPTARRLGGYPVRAATASGASPVATPRRSRTPGA